MSRRFASQVMLICLAISFGCVQAATVTWKSSTTGAYWVDKPALTTTSWDNDTASYISINENSTDQEIFDWSGCINERPWNGLMKLSPAIRDSAVKAMFDTVEGICTNVRCPIGMSDMAMGHYVCDDSFTVDYSMARFSIAEDQKYLIPWIKAGMKWNPHLRVWCSPWTPPPWMKTDNDYYGGQLKTDSLTRAAFALYLEKWCLAYRAQGINVFCIYHQNEPEHNNAGWLVTHYEPADYRDYLKNYLYPKFRQDDIPVESGVGTCVQDDSPPTLIPTVLNDTVANSYVTNIAIQYSTKNAQYCHSTWPSKLLWQSETPAGDGNNNWAYAEANWSCMRQYLSYGVNSYAQWDIANINGGVSNQGLKFCAPVVIDTVNKTYILSPAYWQIKHITYFVKPGALRIKSTGNFINHLAFRNRNGQNVVIVADTTASGITVAINLNGQKIKATLPAHSFNSFSIPGTPISDNSSYNQIEAEKYTGQSGTYTLPCSEGGSCLGLIHNNEWAYYYHIDFGSGANTFTARVLGTVGGSIEVRLDSITGTVAGTCTIAPGSAWTTVECPVTGVSGKHALYLKFKGMGTGSLFNLNWWRFYSATSVKATGMAESGNTVQIASTTGKTPALLLDFSRPISQQNLKVCLFDLKGRRIATLYNGRLLSSHLKLPLTGRAMSSGSYLVRVLLNSKIALTKMINY